MLRILTGVTLATVLVVSCGSDDDKRNVRDEDAGAGGEAGDAADPNAGGSSSNAAGQGGTAQTVAGAGGAPLAEGGAGGAPLAGAGGSSAAGDTGSAGAAGAPAEPVSQFDCEPGQYYSGEGGCLVCEGAPEQQVLTCAEAFFGKSVLADGGPIRIELAPFDAPREALPTTVTLTYSLADSVELLEADMTFEFNDSYWQIDVSDVPLNATQMRVQPFTVQALCGDTFTLTQEVIFVNTGSDLWTATCPGQI
jgi:hypothetical protein